MSVYAKGFDCWGLGPPAAAAAAAGYGFRTFYTSFDASKDGTAAAVAQYAAAGIASLVNFETTTIRVMAGYNAGYADAQHAVKEARPWGMPQGAGVLLSADEPIALADIPRALPYYAGSRAGLAALGWYRNGSYAEQALLQALWIARLIDIPGWRSESTAWPGGFSTVDVGIVQTGPGRLAGVDIDINQALVPLWQLGAWFPNRLVTPPPAPVPITASTQEDDMITSSNLAGRAGLSWSAGSKSRVQVGLNPANIQFALDIQLVLTTGPVYVPDPWKIEQGTGVYSIPAQYKATCRGVILSWAPGSASAPYDVYAE